LLSGFAKLNSFRTLLVADSSVETSFSFVRDKLEVKREMDVRIDRSSRDASCVGAGTEEGAAGLAEVGESLELCRRPMVTR
jgi:hypothetical protein